MSSDKEIIVVGAGIAGLASALALTKAGLEVQLVEARERIGGRLFTQRDQVLQAPVELGAEFIHGCPPEIWVLLRQLGVKPEEVSGENWCFRNGKLKPCDFFSEVDMLFERMKEQSPDECFTSFLVRCCPEPELEEAKIWATGYITGFHAADPAEISVHSIIKSARADEQVQAERAFRIPGGYGFLVDYFVHQLRSAKVPIQLSTVINEIQWKKTSVTVKAKCGNEPVVFQASRVLITVPLPLLRRSQANVPWVHFTPELPIEKLRALDRLAMGQAMRVVLRFRERFWDHLRPQGFQQSLSDLRFLFSRQQWFPTWWTSMPDKLPIITGWAAFHDAKALSGRGEGFIIDTAFQTLSQLFGIDAHEIANLFAQAYWHDWEQDPFSRGAYSYVKVGGASAQRDLGAPVDSTLFFAGEATDVSGHNGTVHGALASAQRAVDEILGKNLRRSPQAAHS